MTQEQVKQAVSKLISLSVSNQPNYIYSQLKARGFSYPYRPTGAEMEAKLYGIYMLNKADFYKILAGVQYDPTLTNASTNQESINYLSSLATNLGISAPSAKISFGNIWSGIVGALGGQDTSVITPTVVTETKANTIAVVGLIVVAILVVVITYFVFFKNK